MDILRRLLGGKKADKPQTARPETSADEDGEVLIVHGSLILFDEGPESIAWPLVPKLTPAQAASEKSRLQRLMDKEVWLKELISQSDSRDDYLNLRVRVEGEHRGHITLTGADIDHQRRLLEQTFAATTEEDGGCKQSPPLPFNSLALFELGSPVDRLTVWFGPDIEEMCQLYAMWFAAHGDGSHFKASFPLVIDPRL